MGSRRMMVWRVGCSLLGGLLLLSGCADPMEPLAALSASGSIEERAPVKAHAQIQIDAPPARVWALLVNATSWPSWEKDISHVDSPGPLRIGTRFTWKTGGLNIHSEVHLFNPEQQLSWTGSALTARAVHVWALIPEPGGQTLVRVDESMNGPWMARLFPSEKLASSDMDWLKALKQAAEHGR